MMATRTQGSRLTFQRLGLLGCGLGLLLAATGCSGSGDSPSPDGAGGMGAGGEGSMLGNAGTGDGTGVVPDSNPPPVVGNVVPDVGTKPLHRLSNVEYDNTVYDLLGTTLRPGLTFQPDNEALGFLTIADAADMNPRHVKDYFEAAEKLVDDVFVNPALTANIITCQPADAADVNCATTIISAFGLRAFRRPLETTEVNHYIALYQSALAMPLTHDEAIAHVVRAMLSAPQFLYRMEIDPDPFSIEMRALNGYEIASRLSYMLWSTMPDPTLFALAGDGSLLQLDTLQTQVDRMLLDVKSSALVDNFTWQWFGMGHLEGHAVDNLMYPAWNDTMRASMEAEMRLFFGEFVHQDRPVSELLTADVNYVDTNLAQVYGVTAPDPAGFTRMEITTDERKGVLGLAGFLTHTSRHNRTAPTIRAAWVLNGLLCFDIKPPENLVIAPLPEADPNVTSVRELIEAHRNNPACSACHDLVDPVGLGMEHYDGIGRYRETYENGDAIDTAGVLPGGVSFTGFSDMLDKLGAMTMSADDPTLKTVQCAAKKLFTYGLGRAVSPSDAYLEQLVTNWEGQPLSLNNLIKQLVVNDVFRFRHGTPAAQ